MATLGSASLIAALLVSVYGVGAALYGSRRGLAGRALIVSARRATYALAFVLTVAIVVVEGAFLSSDFSFALVANNSSTTTPDFYKATALWASQAGSLLLWVWLLSLFASAALFAQRKKVWKLLPYANAVLLTLAAFFVVLLIFFDSPFAQINPVAEGAGLNPLLRYPTMMIHPPSLYIGYVGFSIPFAFAVGALITRQLSSDWLKAVRGYTLFAWAFLSFGILLGARWSYAELGWGGYWAWDPVENASLMPWLVGTAFLHSSAVQQRRGMLKIWNMSLVVATFSLALLGTFLVRSGVLSSIHAFGESTVGTPFLILIASVLIGSVVLLVNRVDDLRSTRRMQGLFSRESVFLVNNLLLVGLCFVIFWGTFFPLLSELVTGHKSSLGAPWFNQYTTPLAIGLVLFSGVGPLLAWGGSSWRAVRRNFVLPLAAAVAAGFLLFLLTGSDATLATLLLAGSAGFAATAVVAEFWRTASARKSVSGESLPTALALTLQRNRRRYGGYIAHLGLVLLLAGVAFSSAFQNTRDLRLKPGQSATVAGYKVRYSRPTAAVDGEKINFGAVIKMSKNGKTSTLRPSRSYFPADSGPMGSFGRFFAGESTSEVGLKAGATTDLWTAMQPDLRELKGPIREANRRFPDPDSAVLNTVIRVIVARYLAADSAITLRVAVNPIVTWIWVGGLTLVIGAAVGLWPSALPLRRRRSELAKLRLGREPSQA